LLWGFGVIFFDENGQPFRYFRQRFSENIFSSIRIQEDRFVISGQTLKSDASFGEYWGFWGRVKQNSAEEIVLRDLDFGVPSTDQVLGKSLWVMNLYGKSMVSFDLEKYGTDEFFDKFSDVENDAGLLEVGGFCEVGAFFLSAEYRQTEKKLRWGIFISDGKTKPKPFSLPPPSGDDASPMFAGTHVGWLRGVGYLSPNSYSSVELWASEFSPDADQVKPFKVMNLSTPHINNPAHTVRGGWGRVLFSEGGDSLKTGGISPCVVRVVDLAGKGDPVTISLPTSFRLGVASGVTRTHAWFMLDELGDHLPPLPPLRRLIRWKLPPVDALPE